MIKTRVKKLEKKHVRNTKVCIVMPGESKTDALRRAMLKFSKLNHVFFIKIIGV